LNAWLPLIWLRFQKRHPFELFSKENVKSKRRANPDFLRDNLVGRQEKSSGGFVGAPGSGTLLNDTASWQLR
jgi:hypothetical protein